MHRFRMNPYNCMVHRDRTPYREDIHAHGLLCNTPSRKRSVVKVLKSFSLVWIMDFKTLSLRCACNERCYAISKSYLATQIGHLDLTRLYKTYVLLASIKRYMQSRLEAKTLKKSITSISMTPYAAVCDVYNISIRRALDYSLYSCGIYAYPPHPISVWISLGY